MFFIFQIAIVCGLLAYLWQRRAYLRRRNLQSWESLQTQLLLYPEDSKSPWTRFQNARIVLEMADYAERHHDADLAVLDALELKSLRRDAMELRMTTFQALLRSVFP